ncbi:MAG: acyl carrier protein [Proteobacteria bacterium]|nr:acyl carrier protein [Pseudomonadota bacterium]
MAHDGVEEKVTSIIATAVKEMTGLAIELTSDQSLIDSGILDSLSIVNVIKCLQSEFSIDISAGDITLENFDTIGSITQFIKIRTG